MSDQSSSSTSRPASPVNSVPEVTSPRTKSYRFNWETASFRNGPASVSGTSYYEGNADYITGRQPTNLFNMSLTSLAPGALPSNWSSSVNGFHAISNVLNNPKRPLDPPKAHQPVPQIPSSSLPPVKRKDFEPYIKAISSEWNRFEKNVMLGLMGTAQIENGILDSGIYEAQKSLRQQHGSSLHSLGEVPSVFFEEDFNLGLPSTFTAVVRDQADPASEESPQILEKFSQYADTIELHLIHEISIRSSSFFAALTNLRDLQTESESCLSRVRELRASLKEVDNQNAKRGLQLVHLEAKMSNLNAVEDGSKVVSGVNEAMQVAKELVTAGQWEEALDVIDGIQELWNSTSSKALEQSISTHSPLDNGSESSHVHSPSRKPPKRQLSFDHTFPISSLHAFAGLPEELRVLTLDVASSLSAELLTVLKDDLTSILSSADEGPTEKIKSDVIERMKFILQTLDRTKGFPDFVGGWRNTALVVLENGIKKHLPQSNKLDGILSQGIIGDDLQKWLTSKTHLEFMSFIRNLFIVLRNGMHRVQEQNNTITEILELMQPLKSSLDLNSFQSDLLDVLFSVTEAAHSRIARLIEARSEQHVSLSLVEFLDVYSETWDFVIQTETVCRRMIVGLRGAVVSQAKAFLQTSHAQRITQLAKVVEDEQWSVVDVETKSQAVVNILIDAAMRDPPQLILSKQGAHSEDQNGAAINGTKTAKHLLVEDRSYFAVSATLQILSLLIEYLKVVINFPLLTTDVVGRVMEFLKAFNSRTCQVVLGAGAMRSAGLKNITAKHLALASQSLAIVIALIPYVRETFRRHLNPKQAVMLTDFDKLKRDYLEHQNEIHLKLIAIMNDRLSAHCKTLQTVDWKTPRAEVNEYMLLLVKETVTLHKVLSRYLPEQIIEYVMSEVFAAIKHRLSEEYEKIELPNQESKDRLLRDTQYLHQKLSALSNLNVPTNMLETIVSEKRVLTSPKPTAQPVSLTANERLKGIFDRPRRGQTSGKDMQRKNSSASIFAAPEKIAEKNLASLPSPPPYEKEKELPAIEQKGTEPDRAVELLDDKTDPKEAGDITEMNDKQIGDGVLTASPTETAAPELSTLASPPAVSNHDGSSS